MPVAGFDHVAITVADVDATLAWYQRVLGAEPLHLDLWRSGKLPIALLQVGASRLSVHPAASPAAPHADVPTPGSADLCFRFDGPVAEILALLGASDVPVVDGPVGRPASNGAMGASVYFRDPDGNLLELLTLEGKRVVDFTETPEHAMLRAAAGDVAAEFGHDWFRERARADGRADELWQALAATGFLSVHLPEEHGGGGGGMSELLVVSEAAAAQGCPLLLVLVSAGISAELLARFGTDDQRARWLPGLCTGEKMVFAITEPDAGSNSHDLSTTATHDGDVYRLRGTKTYISGVDEAPRMLVVARTGADGADSSRPGRAQLSLFVVDTDAPGLDRTPIPVEVTIPEKQFQLFFDDVEVPADRLVGVEGDGLRQVFYGLNPERILSASICTGIGLYALARASAYAREREVWGVPIGTHQGVAHPLARAKIELELARLMTQKAAWMHDHAGDDADDRVAAGEAANMAKFAAAEAGAHCLDAAIQTHGGNGMATEYGLADLWGLVRLLRIAPVSHEMILNFVAQQSLGLPKSY